MGLKYLQMPRPELFLAAKEFLTYRQKGEAKQNILGDFLVSAHIAVSRMPVLTRDTLRYKIYFPSVQLVSPNLLH
jgi:hypothetical protein